MIVIQNEQCEYSGELKDNKAHGEGIATLKRSKNLKWKGTFRDGEPHGIGEFSHSLLIFIVVCTSADNNVIVQEYHQGKKHGKGTHIA